MQLSATVRDQNNNPMTGQTVNWTSSNTSVATVSGNGLVTAVSNGMAETTARAGQATGTAAITVAQVPASVHIEVDAEATTLTETGHTLQLMVSVSDANDHPITDPDVTWTSSDDSVVTVDEDGLVTAVGVGMASIRAVADGVTSAPVRITVLAPEITTLEPSAPNYGPTEAGKRALDEIVVTARSASGGPIADASWRWETDEQSGWVYPSQGVTGTDGRIAATWIAGSPGTGSLFSDGEKLRVNQDYGDCN